MSLNPYLTFNGNAQEALDFYRTALGGDAQIMRFADHAEAAAHFGPEMSQKIMHASLQTPLGMIMLSDAPPEDAPIVGGNVRIVLHAESDDQAENVFATLSGGGEVSMPLGKTFFADKFGICTDKFGIGWMVVYAREASAVR